VEIGHEGLDSAADLFLSHATHPTCTFSHDRRKNDGGALSKIPGHPAVVVPVFQCRSYLATSPGTPSWIAKEAFVLTGDPGVVT
jgi:hypothetical protein